MTDMKRNTSVKYLQMPIGYYRKGRRHSWMILPFIKDKRNCERAGNRDFKHEQSTIYVIKIGVDYLIYSSVKG